MCYMINNFRVELDLNSLSSFLTHFIGHVTEGETENNFLTPNLKRGAHSHKGRDTISVAKCYK